MAAPTPTPSPTPSPTPALPAHVVATFAGADAERVGRQLDGLATVTAVAGLDDAGRRRAMAAADALLVWNWSRELRPGEGPELSARFVQLISAGADHLPFDQLPAGATVASNVGGYAEPMAEHVLAMVLAIYKRLDEAHRKLAGGEWDQLATRSLDGATCAVIGYGGIGRATARLLRAFGARIFAVNTSGRTDDPVEWCGTLDDLPAALAAADVVVLSLPLTRRTRGLVGERELAAMKPDAVLVNVARGAVVDQDALYRHLVATPTFTAAIDAWWAEPMHEGAFRLDHPFFDLPNVLGSPHNSAMVPGAIGRALGRAVANVGRFLQGEPVTGVVRPEDYG